MLVLPGPAIVVIPLALAILATEFVWARRLTEKVKSKMNLKGKRLTKTLPSENRICAGFGRCKGDTYSHSKQVLQLLIIEFGLPQDRPQSFGIQVAIVNWNCHE